MEYWQSTPTDPRLQFFYKTLDELFLNIFFSGAQEITMRLAKIIADRFKHP